ncbi:MAG TPA: carbon-nitrogen hydrolase family protein [Chloroflexi bacterium]|nr:carbon-nitrogen hydrolase family protein [Chloroflexota bacterium]
MGENITIAAVQMDAALASTADRLARAEQLVTEAAAAGAQLVVLPELFNVGYGYSDENYCRAERPDGPTAAWMRETAARLGVHLAGSLMLLDQDDVYNGLLLWSPDGRVWRYDKQYPWAWERAYFRGADRITVAETDLGAIGMLICWDAGHLGLWRRYAGRVDLMVVVSCPPNVGEPTYHFPDGAALTFDDMGPLMGGMKGSAGRVFGEMIEQQAAWLGVPVVNTVGSGHIRTPIPNGLASFLSFVPLAPWLIRYLPQAHGMEMACDMTPGTKVVGADGRVLAALSQEQGESFAIAAVTLPDERPSPSGKTQPASPLSPLVYFASDVVLPALSVPVYRRGLRQAWGERMAPVHASMRRWSAVLGLGVVVGVLMGWLWKRRRS